MIEMFDLEAGSSTSELYRRYKEYYAVVDSLTISLHLKDTFKSIVNKAYDKARAHTAEAQEAALSPRAAQLDPGHD
jgi:hypothetical protein